MRFKLLRQRKRHNQLISYAVLLFLKRFRKRCKYVVAEAVRCFYNFNYMISKYFHDMKFPSTTKNTMKIHLCPCRNSSRIRITSA